VLIAEFDELSAEPNLPLQGLGAQALQEHLFYLEFAKLILVVRNFRPSIRAESRKLKKIYPGNISLAFPSSPLGHEQ